MELGRLAVDHRYAGGEALQRRDHAGVEVEDVEALSDAHQPHRRLAAAPRPLELDRNGDEQYCHFF